MKLLPPLLTILPTGFGDESSGNVSYNEEYFYVKYKGWRRFPLFKATELNQDFPLPKENGDIYTDSEYFYITINKQWRRVQYCVIKPNLPIGDEVSVLNIRNTKMTSFPKSPDNYGTWGLISVNAEYFCVWAHQKWHRIPIYPMPKKL